MDDQRGVSNIVSLSTVDTSKPLPCQRSLQASHKQESIVKRKKNRRKKEKR